MDELENKLDELENKLGEWVPVDSETHVMPIEIEIDASPDHPDVLCLGARCVMQVETDSGVALAEIFVPAALLLRWIEEEDED